MQASRLKWQALSKQWSLSEGSRVLIWFYFIPCSSNWQLYNRDVNELLKFHFTKFNFGKSQTTLHKTLKANEKINIIFSSHSNKIIL